MKCRMKCRVEIQHIAALNSSMTKPFWLRKNLGLSLRWLRFLFSRLLDKVIAGALILNKNLINLLQIYYGHLSYEAVKTSTYCLFYIPLSFKLPEKSQKV